MSTTGAETPPSRPAQSQDRYQYDYRDRPRRGQRGIFISTEARPGFITTEFWLTILGVAALIILAFAVDELGDKFGVACATGVLVAYILSRGIAKGRLE